MREKHNFRHSLIFDMFDLDLGRRNLTLVRDTPNHYILSFYEVSLNCFGSIFVIAETRV